MEKTLNVNYPVLRQGCIIEYVPKKTQSLDSFLYILSIYSFLLHVLRYNVVSFECGVFQTYSIIHPYFALVQGSSHQVPSPSILYPPWYMYTGH